MSVPLTAPGRISSRSFGALWAAGDLGTLGNGILLVALLTWVYRIQESSTVTGILVVGLLLPSFLLRPLANWLAAGSRIRPLGIAAQLLQTAALLPLLAVRSDDDLPMVLVVALLAALPLPFLQAYRKAFVRCSLHGDRLAAVESAFTNSKLMVLVAGPAAGTALFVTWGLNVAAVAGLAAFALALVLTIVAGAPPVGGGPAETPPAASPVALQGGLIYAWQHPPLRTVVILQLLAALVGGGWLIAVTSFTVWGLFNDSAYVGAILASQAVGLAAAFTAYPLVGRRFRPSSVTATALGILAGAGFALNLSDSMIYALPFALALGIGVGLLIRTLDALVDTHSPKELRPSVSAGLGMATEAAILISSIATGPLADQLTPRLVIALISLLLGVLGLYAFGAVPDGTVTEGES